MHRPPRAVPFVVTVALLLSGLVGAVGTASTASAATDRATFDLQSHRGGIALTVESTVPAFAKALRRGVSTLELDVQITEDRRAVVTHDRVVSGRSPAMPGRLSGRCSPTAASTT